MKSTLLIALILTTLSLAAAAQTIYKWTDDKGVTHYGQTPPPNVKATVAGIRVDKPSTQAKAVAETPEQAQANRLKAQRAATCKAALAQVTAARSQPQVYHADANGNRVYTTDSTTEARVRAATIQMRKNCDG